MDFTTNSGFIIQSQKTFKISSFLRESVSQNLTEWSTVLYDVVIMQQIHQVFC